MLKPSAWVYAHVFLEGHAIIVVIFIAGLFGVLNFKVGHNTHLEGEGIQH
jgi:hypothetical protein